MTASDHISRQLFHASTHYFKVGDTINSTGRTNSAWATPDDKFDAKNYAQSRAQEAGQLFAPYYEVEPVDPDEHIEGISNTYSDTVDPKTWKETGETPHSVISKKGFRITSAPKGYGYNPDVDIWDPGDRMYDHKGGDRSHPNWDPYQKQN